MEEADDNSQKGSESITLWIEHMVCSEIMMIVVAAGVRRLTNVNSFM